MNAAILAGGLGTRISGEAVTKRNGMLQEIRDFRTGRRA